MNDETYEGEDDILDRLEEIRHELAERAERRRRLYAKVEEFRNWTSFRGHHEQLR